MVSQNKPTRIFALFILSALLGLSMMLESCTDSCTDSYSYTYYKPVYTQLSDIRSSVGILPPQPLSTIGKIYFKDGFLFINDPGEGIHVIDNSDPSNPLIKSFINIPGNFDLAIRNNILYADSYIDLVAIDISDINHVVEVSRLKNIFASYNSLGFYADEERGVVTEWVESEEVTIDEHACENKVEWWGGFYYREGIMAQNDVGFSSKALINPGNSTGVGGSMARFTINSDHLYMLDGGNIHTADISIPSKPESKSSQYLGWDIETIFPYSNKLFIGTRNGMHILDLSIPETPEKIATYEHVTSCDPVVVDGDYAYVTLRSGTECQGFTNQLEVIDVSTITIPSLLKTYSMVNPHGLGVDEATLFICDGEAGLKIYNIEDKQNIDKNLIKHYSNIHAYDAIPFNDVLMLIGEDGIFQYDYSDLSAITKLSQIKVQREN